MMATQRRHDDAVLDAARAEDDLERLVHGLTCMFPPADLEEILRSMEIAPANLAGAAPLIAAAMFRDAVLAQIRSGRVSIQTLDQALARIEPSARPPLRPLFDRALFVFGLRRGGNHAVASWLKGHFPEAEVLHLNSAEICLFNVDGTTLTADHHKYSAVSVDATKRVLIVGYENLDPLFFPFAHNRLIAYRSDAVVVLRDYVNMAASIARQAREAPAFAYRYRIRDLIDLWPRYAGYFRSRSFGHTYISFNEWFASASTRAAISRELGLEPSDQGLRSVSAFGEGSSFDGTGYDGRAQDMDVLGRWMPMKDDPLFRFLLLASDDALELSHELFGGSALSREELLEQWRAV
jgi:hypothetical protein